tara:strand:+ start:573 stop:869 length:297 start_codon:yes stop_codon:yes gene_type:complete
MKHENYKENLNDNKSEEFINAMNLLRKRLERINDRNRLDILMHMLLSKGIFDLVNHKKGIILNSEDYGDLTQDDYIETTENILSELNFFERELDRLIN